MRFTFALLVLAISTVVSSAQTTQREMLLTNMKVQMECTEAIDSLYNFNFYAAEKQFNWIKQSYPDHPLPYFLMVLSNWWKIVPNDDVKDYDEVFFAYLDTTISKAEKLLKKDKTNPEPAFFLAAAYGFKARRQSDHGDYVSSAFTARKCLEYMHIDSKGDVFSPEFLFGEGLYNYYRAYLWESNDYKYLRSLLVLFKDGDKQTGLDQLEKVSREAFYARVEAKYHLMEIYGYREGDREGREKSLEIAKELAEKYPRNSYFNMVAAEMALKVWERPSMLKYATVIVDGYKNGLPGYSGEVCRKAAYVLSKYYPQHSEERILALKLMVECAKEADGLGKCYTIHSCKDLAEYEDKNGNVEEALKYCEIIVDNIDKDDCRPDKPKLDRSDKDDMSKEDWKDEKKRIKKRKKAVKESGPYLWAEEYIDNHTEKSWYQFW